MAHNNNSSLSQTRNRDAVLGLELMVSSLFLHMRPFTGHSVTFHVRGRPFTLVELFADKPGVCFRVAHA